MKHIILAAAAALLVLKSGGARTTVEAVVTGDGADCQMEMWVFDSFASCNAGDPPSATGRIYADGQCHTIETDANTTSDTAAYALFPGHYRAESTADGNIRFVESGCMDQSCTVTSMTTGAVCDRDDSTAAALYSNQNSPLYLVQNPSLATVGGIYTCYIVEGAGVSATFAVFGDPTAPGCSGVVDGVFSPSSPPGPQPTKSPEKAPTVTPTTSPVKALTNTPTASFVKVPTKTPSSSPMKAPAGIVTVNETTKDPVPVASQAPIAVPAATAAPVQSQSTGVPVNTPTPIAVTPLKETPVSETAAPSASTAAGEVKPTSASLETPVDTPVDITPRSSGETLTVIEFPRNGSMKVQGDGMLTYTPNAGFVGVDTFKINRCVGADGQCTSESILVEVVTPQSASTTSGSEDSSSPKGVYALALLALLPIFIGAVVFRKRLGCGKNADAAVKIEPIDTPSLGPSYAPTSVSQELEAGGRIQNVVAEAHGVPVQAQRVQNQAVVTPTVYLPDYKDQCRVGAADNSSRETPMAMAVVMYDDDDKERRA